MSLKIKVPENEQALKPRITVYGVGGGGCNAVNNMIRANVTGVEFVVANTDAQALENSLAERKIQLGLGVTRGLGAGSNPDVGRQAAEENFDEIISHLQGSNMVFVTAGMGGGTGSGAAPVIARAAREQGILTVGVVTKPFHFEGKHRMKIAEGALNELSQYVDTLIVIPNQNLFRVANEKTTFAEAFKLADDVLHAGVRGVTDLMVMPGLINLDFADIRTVMSEMGKAMMGTGEAEGANRAIAAAEAAISNPLLEDTSMKGARGVLINITGGLDMTLFEVDEAANRIREEVDPDANIIFGSTFDEKLEGRMRISVVATGIHTEGYEALKPESREEGSRDILIGAKSPTHYTGRPAQPKFQSTYPYAPTAASPQNQRLIANDTPRRSEGFIPPRAVSPEEMERSHATSTRQAQAEAFAATPSHHSIKPAAPVKSAPPASDYAEEDEAQSAPAPSLFERFTGLGGRKKSEKAAPRAAKTVKADPVLETASRDPQLEDESGYSEEIDETRTLESLATSPRESEDSLDIPAFLRRQAN